MFMSNKMRRFSSEKKRVKNTNLSFLYVLVTIVENPNSKIYDRLTWHKGVLLGVHDEAILTKMLCWMRWLIQVMFVVDDIFDIRLNSSTSFF